MPILLETRGDTKLEIIKRYQASSRWFHWLIAAAFLELVISGLLIFFHLTGPPLVGALIRIIHRIAVVFLLAAPLLYTMFNWQKSWHFVKEAITWDMDDIKWLLAAPLYYFGWNPKNMPAQGYSNTGMKMYRVAVLAGSALFIASGAVMWFFKGIVPSQIFQWSLVVHDITFVIAVCMFMLHVWLGVFHPRMDESLLAIIDGDVSGEYAKSHHRKWYDEIYKKTEDITVPGTAQTNLPPVSNIRAGKLE